MQGAYQQTCINLEERSFTLELTGDTITVYQGTNAEVWQAGQEVSCVILSMTSQYTRIQ